MAVDLYTSRWANKGLAHLACQPVGISRGVPRFPLAYRYKLARWLAPSAATFALEDPREYEASYAAQLEAIGLDAIVGRLGRIAEEAGGQPLVLLCYEDLTKPGQWCHRQHLSAFLLGRGVEIRELGPGDLPHRPDAPQQALF